MSATVPSRKPRWIFSVGRDAVEVLATTAGDRNRDAIIMQLWNKLCAMQYATH